MGVQLVHENVTVKEREEEKKNLNLGFRLKLKVHAGERYLNRKR